jgi:hypothetical protein
MTPTNPQGTPQPTAKTANRPLDTTRPFMDDKTPSISVVDLFGMFEDLGVVLVIEPVEDT